MLRGLLNLFTPEQTQAILAWARKHGVYHPQANPVQGFKEVLRRDADDDAHAHRAYDWLRAKRIPDTVEGIERQHAQALEQTRDAGVATNNPW